jgi:hypothetical protein
MNDETNFQPLKDMLSPMGYEDLLTVRCLVDAEIEARRRQRLNKLLTDGWWVKEYGTADAALTMREKCLILGVMHPEHNPHGEKRNLLVIKGLRDRFPGSILPLKELVDAYEWEVASWKVPAPQFDEGERL